MQVTDQRLTVPRTRGGPSGSVTHGDAKDTTVISLPSSKRNGSPVSDTLGRAYCLFLRKRLCLRLRYMRKQHGPPLCAKELVLLVGDRRENSPSWKDEKECCTEDALLHLGSCLLGDVVKEADIAQGLQEPLLGQVKTPR